MNLNEISCKRLAVAVLEQAVKDYVEDAHVNGRLVVDERELNYLAHKSPWLDVLDLDPDAFIDGCRRRKEIIKNESNLVRI